MRIRLAMVGMMCFSPATFAASKAVEDVHYQAGAALQRSEFSGSDATGTSFGISGALTLPLGEYFGASATGAHNRMEISSSSLSCDVSGSALGLSLFVRAPEFGRIGASYSRGSAGSCTSSALGSSSSSTDTDSVSLLAEYYFEPLTLRISRSRTEYEQGPAFDQATAEASWYPTVNAKFGVSVAGLDATDTYGAHFENQPRAFGNSTSISAAYAHADGSDSLSLGVTYFFDRRVDLKRRDRHYR